MIRYPTFICVDENNFLLEYSKRLKTRYIMSVQKHINNSQGFKSLDKNELFSLARSAVLSVQSQEMYHLKKVLITE